jgi:hypothetical protein
LAAAGADVGKIVAIQYDAPDDGALLQLSMGYKLAALRAALEATADCKLVVIDPLSAFLDGPDGRRSGAMQMLLHALANLARKFRVAIVAVAPLMGNASQRSVDRLLTTFGPAAAARSVWGILLDPDDAQRRLMISLDGNFAEERQAFCFRLSTDGVPHVEWGEGAATSVKKILNAKSAFRVAEQNYRDSENHIVTRLREVLSGGPKERIFLDLLIAASESQLYRAAKRLGVVTDKPGFYDGWTWMLPEHFPQWQAEQEQRKVAEKLERRRRKNEKRRRARAEEAQGCSLFQNGTNMRLPIFRADRFHPRRIAGDHESARREKMMERLRRQDADFERDIEQAEARSRREGDDEEVLDFFAGGLPGGVGEQREETLSADIHPRLLS